MFEQILMTLLCSLIRAASPAVVKGIRDMLGDLEKKAKKTKNPVDDVLVEMLKKVFGAD